MTLPRWLRRAATLLAAGGIAYLAASLLSVLSIANGLARRGGAGRFPGAPYDWRRSTLERARERAWNPNDPRMLAPKGFGWGRTVNPGRLAAAARAARRERVPRLRGSAARRVLVVEDDADARRYFCAVLADRAGCRVEAVADGRTALARAAEEPPDLILLDIGLPDVSGVTVARRVRQSPSTRRVRILGVSGLIRAGESYARVLGFDAVLAKPVGPEALAESVRALLGTHGAAHHRPERR